ncbi:MAG: carbonic anhydrase [Hyphomonadaceae bacterium]|nr:carbonic anhydrase [Hyphomonadaceae bacterium]MBC6411841.1 carbonic anhydrase [Hyphomonadaceae bacterium]
MPEVSKARLIKGYRAFRSGEYLEQKALYEALGEGQHPRVMLVACSDSRVDPTDIFNACPGEMFVARNVANIVPQYKPWGPHHCTSATVEYAVNILKVKLIIVLGHENCGGVAGCLAGMGDDPVENFVGAWVSQLNTARDRVVGSVADKDGWQPALEHEGIRQSLENLTGFPCVRAAVEAGELGLLGAYFSIRTAELMFTDTDGNFAPVDN